jgi:hypothetical protein
MSHVFHQIYRTEMNSILRENSDRFNETNIWTFRRKIAFSTLITSDALAQSVSDQFIFFIFIKSILFPNKYI